MRGTKFDQQIEFLQERVEELHSQAEELVAARAGLEAERQRYLDLFEFAPDGYLVTDPAGVIREANRAAAELLGLRREILSGKPLAAVVSPGDRKAFRTRLADMARLEPVRGWELSLLRRKEPFPASLTVAGVRDTEGELVALRWMIRDITERRRAEAARREAEERFRTSFERAPIGVALTAPDGRFFAVNRAFADMLGYSREELLGMDVLSITHPEDAESTRTNTRRLLAGELDGFRLEKRYLRKDGQVVWGELAASVVRDEKGKLRHFIGQVLDITERKRAEAEIANLARFPSENPNPVLRIAKDGSTIYANEPGSHFLSKFGCQPGAGKPGCDDWRQVVADVLASGSNKEMEIQSGGRTFSFTFAPVPEAGYVNIYGLDISERVRAEEARRRSEERLDLALAATGLGFWDRDVETDEVVYDRRYWEMLGYEPGEMELQSHASEWAARLHPEDKPGVMERYEAHLRGETPFYEAEFRLRTKAGNWRWILSRGLVVEKSEAGKPLRMIGTHLDISERVRAEEALERERRLLEAVFESSQTLLVYLDRDFNFVWVNEAYARACARGKEEFAGHSHFEFYPHPANQAIFERVRDTGEPFVAVARPFTFPDHPEWGETYWDWTLTPVGGPAGEVEGFVFSLVDVTERVCRLRELDEARGRIEELAQAEEARANWLAAVLDQIPTGVYIARAPDVKIILGNRAADELSGFPTPLVKVGDFARHWQVFRPDGQPMPSEELPLARAVMRGEHVRGEELILERPDGSQVNLITNAVPLREEGEVTGGVVTFWDITAEKETQRKLEEASRLKDEFLSMASHELRTPITSIKIFSELASRRPERVTPEFLGRVLHQADQLAQLISDLLDVSRLELGRMPMKTQPLDLGALAGEICERQCSIFEERQVSCAISQEEVLVKGDPARLEQVFTNLLDNAAKYSPEGGPIWVRVSRQDGKALVEVQDEGIGIAPEHLPHIFERFYKPGLQQAVYAGLGVGLYISKEIVERHGGRIWAESQVGNGSTFFVELPLAS